MKCRYCGRPLDPESAFCKYCGERRPPVQRRRPEPTREPVPAHKAAAPKAAARTLPKWIIPTICVTVIVVLLAAILAMVLGRDNSPANTGEVPEETNVVVTAAPTEPTTEAETYTEEITESTEPPYENDAVWAQAYYNQIIEFETDHADINPDKGLKYRLLYIDDNEVPELYMQAGEASALYTYLEDDGIKRIYEAKSMADEKLIGVRTRCGTYLSSSIGSSGERYAINKLNDGKVTETESYHAEDDSYTINGASVDLVSYTEYVRAKQADYQLSDIPIYTKDKLLDAMTKAAAGEDIPNPAGEEDPDETFETLETDDETEETDDASSEKRFEVFSGMYTWSQAQAKCKEKGGHLAYIKSADDYNAVLEAIKEADDSLSYLWVGGKTYIDDDGETVTASWVDGSSTSYIDRAGLWFGHEPSGKDGDTLEPYMMLWNLGSGWTFNDNSDSCVNIYSSGSMGYVCEFHD